MREEAEVQGEEVVVHEVVEVGDREEEVEVVEEV